MKPRDTNGCIVLENGNINELTGYVKLHETPVIITPRIEWVSPDSLKTERYEVETVIERWKEAWANKDKSSYMNFYSPRFSARGMGWHGWKGYKNRFAKKYGKIEVNIDNLQLLKTNGIILASFNQTYNTMNFMSQGEKRLYLAKNSNEWKIISEFFAGERIGKKVPSRLPAADLNEIKDFIDTWKSAWELQDLSIYISLYDQNFRSRGMDLNAWKRYKEEINKKYRSIKIQLSKLKITRYSANSARVRFRQIYQADAYHDLGVKNLFLVRGKEGWKIKKETWNKIARNTPE